MISTSENQVIYLGNGENTHFSYNFKIINYTDLHLIRVDKNGNETEVTSDFYVHMDTSIVDYPGYAPGAVEPVADQPLPLQTGEKLVIYRYIPITQEDDMPEQWPFDVIENALDKSCIIDQQLKGDVDRALKVKRSIPINDFNMEFPVPGDENGYGLRVTNSGFSLTADPGIVYEETKDYAATAEAAANECEEWADNIVYVGEEQPTFEKTYVWVDTDEDDEYESSIEAQIAAKQEKLVAGSNITIAADGKTISATASVDAYTKNETDTLLAAKANTSTTYTKDEVDGQFTTVSGDITQLYCDIAEKLDANLGEENSGKYLNISSDGAITTCDLPITSASKAGIIKVANARGSTALSDGTLSFVSPTNAEINNRNGFKPMSAGVLDYAVKAALTDGRGQAYTDTEKQGVWSRLTIIKTTMDDIAIANANYYLGEQTTVSVTLPDDASAGQEISVCWYNGETPATLEVQGEMLDYDYTPSANTRSEINALYDGTYWCVLGNEQSLPTESDGE